MGTQVIPQPKGEPGGSVVVAMVTPQPKGESPGCLVAQWLKIRHPWFNQ